MKPGAHQRPRSRGDPPARARMSQYGLVTPLGDRLMVP
jgi:hypothetical protein